MCTNATRQPATWVICYLQGAFEDSYRDGGGIIDVAIGGTQAQGRGQEEEDTDGLRLLLPPSSSVCCRRGPALHCNKQK